MKVTNEKRIVPVVVYKYLLDNTDDENKVTLYQIQDYLKNEWNLVYNRKSMLSLLDNIYTVDINFRTEINDNTIGYPRVYWIEKGRRYGR